MGKIKAIKGLGKAYEEARKEFLKGQENIYKLDKTGKKDKMIKALNKKIRSNIKQQAGPKDIEEYHRIMTKGSKYSPKFFKDK